MLDRDASPPRATTPPRLAALLLVLAVLLGPLLALGAGPAAAAPTAPRSAPANLALADEETGTPLTVTIDGVTPDVGVLAPGTVVTVTGRVTNASDETWTDLQIFPVTSSTPLTTEAELEAAAARPPTRGAGTYTIYMMRRIPPWVLCMRRIGLPCQRRVAAPTGSEAREQARK